MQATCTINYSEELSKYIWTTAGKTLFQKDGSIAKCFKTVICYSSSLIFDKNASGLYHKL